MAYANIFTNNKAQRANELISRFPQLEEVAAVFNRHAIPWMIGGSGCLFVLGNDRVPDDVDIFLTRSAHAQANELFGIQSYEYTSPVERVMNSNPGGDHALQFTSGLRIVREGVWYDLEPTALVAEHAFAVDAEHSRLLFMPPEEPLLIKALLRRGPEVGKHDLEDIKKFHGIYSIDKAYLNRRAVELRLSNNILEPLH